MEERGCDRRCASRPAGRSVAPSSRLCRPPSSLELLHNAFLVHDDIEDGSLYRRNDAAMYLEEGIPIAINVGDAMNVLSVGSLIENIPVLGADLSYRIFHEVAAPDPAVGRRPGDGARVDPRQPVRPDRGRLPADGPQEDLLVHVDSPLPDRCADRDGRRDRRRPVQPASGSSWARAFQIQDDVLNLIGDQDRYGKEILGDIWEGKRTLMLVHALRQGTANERERLARVFAVGRERRTEKDVEWVFHLFGRHGSIDFARAALRRMVEAAQDEFDVAFRDARERPTVTSSAGSSRTWAIESSESLSGHATCTYSCTRPPSRSRRSVWVPRTRSHHVTL